MERRKFLKNSAIIGVGSFIYGKASSLPDYQNPSRPELITSPVKQINSFADIEKLEDGQYGVFLEGNPKDGLYKREGDKLRRLSNTSINLDWFEIKMRKTALHRIINLNQSENLGYAVFLGKEELELSESLNCDNQIFWGKGIVLPDPSQNNYILRIIGNNNTFFDLTFFEKTYCKVLLEVRGSNNFIENCNFKKNLKSASTEVVYSDRFLNLTDPKGKNNQVISCKFNNGRIGAALEGNYLIKDCEVSNCIMGLLLRPSSTDSEISYNMIKDNNVNHKSGADGILAQRNVTKLHIHHNTILNSGEHGIYFQGDNSLIEMNTVNNNFKSGIKLASYDTNLYMHPTSTKDFYIGANNVLQGNNCEHNCMDEKDQTNAGIYLQAPLKNIKVEDNLCSDNTYGIRSTSLAKLKPEELSTKAQLKNLEFKKNEAFNTRKSSFYIEGESEIIIENNKIDSLLTNSKSISHHMENLIIRGNIIKKELVLNRVEKAQVIDNSIGKITIISNSKNRGHVIKSNKRI